MMSTEEMLKQLLDGQNSINQRLDTMDKRFDTIDERFDTIDKRFEAIDEHFGTIDKRFEAIDEHFDTIDKRFEAIDEHFDTIDKRFEAIDEHFGTIDEHFDTIDKRFEAIDEHFGTIDDHFDTINKHFDEVYLKIDEVHDIEAELLNRQDNLQKDVKSIKITLENDISPSIRLLSDLQLENSKRFIVLEKNVETLTDNLVIDEVLNGLNNR